MKKLIASIIALILAITPLLTFAEDLPLTENEKNYLGCWVMFASHGDTTYLYTITFFEDHHVCFKSVTFTGSTKKSDNTSTGLWSDFTGKVIILSLAGNDFTGGINDDGLFVLLNFQTQEPMAFFEHCTDLSDKIV